MNRIGCLLAALALGCTGGNPEAGKEPGYDASYRAEEARLRGAEDARTDARIRQLESDIASMNDSLEQLRKLESPGIEGLEAARDLQVRELDRLRSSRSR